jgi:hypothetical protein
MLSFHAVPLFLMGMLLAAIVLIYRGTDWTPVRKPLTKKELQHLTRKEIDRYVKKHANSERQE